MSQKQITPTRLVKKKKKKHPHFDVIFRAGVSLPLSFNPHYGKRRRREALSGGPWFYYMSSI
jgi:hypothetical protein